MFCQKGFQNSIKRKFLRSYILFEQTNRSSQLQTAKSFTNIITLQNFVKLARSQEAPENFIWDTKNTLEWWNNVGKTLENTEKNTESQNQITRQNTNLAVKFPARFRSIFWCFPMVYLFKYCWESVVELWWKIFFWNMSGKIFSCCQKVSTEMGKAWIREMANC